VHGGAILAGRLDFEPDLAERETTAADEKDHIAKAALAELPAEGTLILDAGTTVARLAAALPLEASLTVVTHSLPIAARRATGEPATVALRDAGRAEVYAWREGEPARRMPTDELAAWLSSSARVMVEPAGMLATWSSGHAHLEIPPAGRRPLSAALADSAIWTFESQKPLRYDEVQALYVQPAAAEERRRKAP